MRFLLKVNIPVESGNAAAKAGKLGATIQSILADLKPEAVYFTDNNGQRSGFIFLEMQDASQIPAIAEPWFLAFNASVEIHPVMIPDDLARAGGAIENAVKKYDLIARVTGREKTRGQVLQSHIVVMQGPTSQTEPVQ